MRLQRFSLPLIFTPVYGMKRRGVKHFGLRSYSFTHGRNENSRNITKHNALVYERLMN